MHSLTEIATKAPKDFDKKQTREETEKLVVKLDRLQRLLYAESKHAVLVILQGMDASGKDGAIDKVFSRLNPQGIFVKAYKVPTEEEKKHDFLWRVHPHAPTKGIFQIFNRSHYEDVVTTRVHGLCDEKTAQHRFKAINAFEELLARDNGTQVFKFYLHISPEEQQERIEERLTDVTKRWKYNENDLKEAKLWDKYIRIYDEAFENCKVIPWVIVPSDQNWYKEYIITKTIVDALEKLDMKYPQSPLKRD
jgi:PPK2 family polyphosphate:nucleotide phosphotransferase